MSPILALSTGLYIVTFTSYLHIYNSYTLVFALYHLLVACALILLLYRVLSDFRAVAQPVGMTQFLSHSFMIRLVGCSKQNSVTTLAFDRSFL